MKPLHVTNGDILAEALDGALPWQDVLHEGPVPMVEPDELREVRARFLADCGWASYEQVLADFARRDETLAEAEELVLWFERDLYDQLQLLQILDRLDGRSATLVVVDGTPRCREELQALYAGRTEIGGSEEELARRAWAAFSSPEPTVTAGIVAGETTALPDVGPALVRLLEDLPWVVDGLSRSERQVVAAAADGASSFEALFRAATALEEHPFMGDAILRLHLERLMDGTAPLVARRGDGFAATEAGREVLAQRADHVRVNSIDRWLGGVHLNGSGTVWRWDPEIRRPVRQV